MTIDSDSYEAGFRLGLILPNCHLTPISTEGETLNLPPSFQFGWRTAKVYLYKAKYQLGSDHIGEGDEPVVTQLADGRSDPVYELRGKYGFRDETWSDSYGPFETREEANQALENYRREVLGQKITRVYEVAEHTAAGA